MCIVDTWLVVRTILLHLVFGYLEGQIGHLTASLMFVICVTVLGCDEICFKVFMVVVCYYVLGFQDYNIG